MTAFALERISAFAQKTSAHTEHVERRTKVRLFDADELMQNIIAHSYPLTSAFCVGGVDDGLFVNGIRQVVDEQPTVDAVEVCRCRDCEHWYGPDDGKVHSCSIDALLRPGDFFCRDGKRREDGDT